MIVRMRNQRYEFSKNMTVRQLLDNLQALPESVVVMRNDEILTEDELVKEPDFIEVIPVISGGAWREM
ncbi:MAG: MoaD/ThiS family protein [Acidobacteria bacterium]|nr:MoaD/ThiS family protein [Acidobacteriota bacterium]MBI3656128.1 MoaD/ThiS family protein [Acidobacteriota bacterium]